MTVFKFESAYPCRFVTGNFVQVLSGYLGMDSGSCLNPSVDSYQDSNVGYYFATQEHLLVIFHPFPYRFSEKRIQFFNIYLACQVFPWFACTALHTVFIHSLTSIPAEEKHLHSLELPSLHLTLGKVFCWVMLGPCQS